MFDQLSILINEYTLMTSSSLSPNLRHAWLKNNQLATLHMFIFPYIYLYIYRCLGFCSDGELDAYGKDGVEFRGNEI